VLNLALGCQKVLQYAAKALETKKYIGNLLKICFMNFSDTSLSTVACKTLLFLAGFF
jgi:hypothetical protein